MRQRSLTSFTSSSVSRNKRTFDGTCSDPMAYTDAPFSGDYNSVNDEKIMNDVVTEGFHKKMKRGLIINNPFDSTREITTDRVADYTSDTTYQSWNTGCTPDKWLTFGDQWSGTWQASDFIKDAAKVPYWASQPAINVQSLIDQAVTQAWANVEVSQATALATLGEFDKTVVSMVSICKRVIKVLKAAKQADYKYLKRQISRKELENRYMELRYAIRPLVYDANSIIKVLRSENNKMRFTARASKSGSDDSSKSCTVVGGTTTQLHKVLSASANRTVEVRAGVLYHVESVSKLNLWGFDQPLEAIWELTPFSFIFDWFFNIGQTLASWTPEMGTKVLASWYVVNDITYYTSTVDSSWITRPADTSTTKYSAGQYDIQNAVMTKTVHNRYRVVDPTRPIIPTFNVRLDGFKLLDLAIIGKRLLARWR